MVRSTERNLNMITKFYSEKLNKYFDTEKECLECEKKHDEEIAKKEAKLNEISNNKKAHVKKIEEIEKDLEKAYADLDIAKKDAEHIVEEARKEIHDILNPVEEKIKELEKKRYNALADFNDKYGPYSRIVTGNEAAKEFQKAVKWFNQFFQF